MCTNKGGYIHRQTDRRLSVSQSVSQSVRQAGRQSVSQSVSELLVAMCLHACVCAKNIYIVLCEILYIYIYVYTYVCVYMYVYVCFLLEQISHWTRLCHIMLFYMIS